MQFSRPVNPVRPGPEEGDGDPVIRAPIASLANTPAKIIVLVFGVICVHEIRRADNIGTSKTVPRVKAECGEGQAARWVLSSMA